MIRAVPSLFRTPETAQRVALIAASHAALLGEPLVTTDTDVIDALWQSPLAIVAHGNELDPLFFFGNAAALAAFEYAPAAFVGLPSRLSAEAPERAERQDVLDRVAAQGFVSDYSGSRVAASGRRFRIAGAAVWNLVDRAGRIHGQAAAFAP